MWSYMNRKKLVIIGAGPSGMMAAISAKTHHPLMDVWLLERNGEVGKKLKMTGGGRCNVTANISIQSFFDYYPKNPKFLHSTINKFGPKEIIDFFESEHCLLQEEDYGRMFPKSGKSEDIIQILLRKILQLNIHIMFNVYINQIDYQHKKVSTKDHFQVDFDYLIMATGGITYPHTGSDGTGHLLAASLGHVITPLAKTEVPLVSNDAVIQSKALQGLAFKNIKISLYNEKTKIIKSIDHDIIFTHFGISGPAALRMSYHVIQQLKVQKEVFLEIDFLKTFSLEDIKGLNQNELVDLFEKSALPKRFTNYVLNHIGVEGFKKFPIKIYDIRGINQAFLTDGGIDVKEIDPKTMKSKIVKNVSFCGEIIDYHGYTGGFNITAALSTGYHAGEYIGDL